MNYLQQKGEKVLEMLAKHSAGYGHWFRNDNPYTHDKYNM